MSVLELPSVTSNRLADSTQFLERFTPELSDSGTGYESGAGPNLTVASTTVEATKVTFKSNSFIQVDRTQRSHRREPTQAYFDAKRAPYLQRLRTHLASLSISSNGEDAAIAVSLCREQISSIWQYVDIRDDHVAQYLEMIGRAIEVVAASPSSAKVHVISSVVDMMIAKRLDYESRRTARLTLSRMSLLVLPELTDDEDDPDFSDTVEDDEK